MPAGFRRHLVGKALRNKQKQADGTCSGVLLKMEVGMRQGAWQRA